MASLGRQLSRMLDELGRISDDPSVLTRTFLSPAMRRANDRVGAWMREAGLTVREDTVGNLIGRLETGTGARRAPTLLLGSHLDTVRNAGRFDGALGVLAPIVALQELARRRVALPFAVEVLGFSEEEGVRFSSAYLGSKGYSGQLKPADLTLRDPDGISIRESLEQHNGKRFTPPPAAHRSADVLGYCEVHIEQGPVLEAGQLALGVVSGIAGQTRARVTFSGQAGHAGTTPMALRRDALAGAAEFVSAVEAFAQSRAPLVATVGTLTIPSAAPNVIPGETTLSLDVRHPSDADRKAALTALKQQAAAIARRRKLTHSWTVTQNNAAVACAPTLTRALEKSVRAVQGRSLTLVSGAGHDGVVVSAWAPICMLFVRCRAGLSHHPAEHTAPDDLEAAVAALVAFIQELAAGETKTRR